MGDVIFKGFWMDSENHEIGDTPDLRWVLCMGANTCEATPDAATVADFSSVDEFDGAGYARLDVAGVAITWETSPSRFAKITCTGGASAFGATVGPGSDNIEGALLIRWVTTLSDSIPWYYTTNGGGFNATGGALGLTVPSDGILVGAQA